MIPVDHRFPSWMEPPAAAAPPKSRRWRARREIGWVAGSRNGEGNHRASASGRQTKTLNKTRTLPVQPAVAGGRFVNGPGELAGGDQVGCSIGHANHLGTSRPCIRRRGDRLSRRRSWSPAIPRLRTRCSRFRSWSRVKATSIASSSCNAVRPPISRGWKQRPAPRAITTPSSPMTSTSSANPGGSRSRSRWGRPIACARSKSSRPAAVCRPGPSGSTLGISASRSGCGRNPPRSSPPRTSCCAITRHAAGLWLRSRPIRQ